MTGLAPIVSESLTIRPERPPKHYGVDRETSLSSCGQALYSAFVILLSFTSWPRGRNHEQADQATSRYA